MRIFLAIVAFTLVGVDCGAARPEAYWGGFAFKGSMANAGKRYPVFHRLLTNDADNGAKYGGDIQAYFRDWFHSKSGDMTGVVLKVGLADIEKTSLSLSFAITEETVMVERLGSNFKVNIQLGFEAVLLDFEKLQVVSSTPILIEFRDATDKEPDDQYLSEKIALMTFGENSQLSKALESKIIQIKPLAAAQLSTLRVLSTSISDVAKEYLPAYMLGGLEAELNSAQIVLGQTFSYMLNDRAGIALLPFIKDSANARMALVFIDGSVVNFTVPRPSFAIDLDLKGFKKVRVKETRAESLWIYGAFLNIRVYDPDLNTDYMNTTYKHGIQKVIPATQTRVDEFPVFNEALKGAILKAISGMQADERTRKVVIENCKI